VNQSSLREFYQVPALVQSPLSAVHYAIIQSATVQHARWEFEVSIYLRVQLKLVSYNSHWKRRDLGRCFQH
jgi:hypothetical protein